MERTIGKRQNPRRFWLNSPASVRRTLARICRDYDRGVSDDPGSIDWESKRLKDVAAVCKLLLEFDRQVSDERIDALEEKLEKLLEERKV